MGFNRGILILSLLALWTTEMSQGINAPPIPDLTTIGFPRLPPDFKETAKKLMFTCSQKGYPVPVIMENSQNSSYTEAGNKMMENPMSVFADLLSSLSHRFTMKPNSTAGDQEPVWNITEKFRNCTSMGHVIELMNTTDSLQCFMRAFIAPLSWMVIMQNGTELSKEDLMKLTWTAKPFLETMPPSNFLLPPVSQSLDAMVKMFAEVFSVLSEKQRNDIIGWIKERVAETEFKCILNPYRSSMQLPPKPQNEQNMSVEMPSSKPEKENKKKEKRPSNGARPLLGEEGWIPDIKIHTDNEEKNRGKGEMSDSDVWKTDNKKHNETSMSFAKCPPNMAWLKSKVLTMMGPFLSRLPLEEVNTISKEELCNFFRSPDFSASFRNVGGMQPSLGRTLFKRLKVCSSTDNFIQQMERFGSLACYFDDVQSLNATLSKKLLSQLDACGNSEIAQVKRLLVQKIVRDDAPPSREMLQSLGSAVSVLSLSKLSHCSPEDLNNTLGTLGQAKWTPAQAKTLATKLLNEAKNISSEKLLSLGSVVRGVSSGLLRNVKAEGLLGKEALKNTSEEMSSLQKKALLEAFRHDVNASELVKEVPDSLLRSLSLSTLEKANLTSVDQLDGHSWTRAQSAFLLKKILGNKINLNELRKLGKAVQGVTCKMIEGIDQTDALEMAQVLSESSDSISRVQIHCAAQKLFASLEEQRPGYFKDITTSELQAIPVILLIHLPPEKIQNLTDSVCSVFLSKMNQVNLSSLSNNAPSRFSLTERAVRCLLQGRSVSDLSAADILPLGPLVCMLNPGLITLFKPEAVNATLLALASCQYIPQQHRQRLFKLLTDTYGEPSNWSEDDMRILGPLLLLNDTAVEKLPFKSWLKATLSDLMHSLSIQAGAPRPKEFRFWFDLTALRRKLFDLKTTQSSLQSRRRREVALNASEPILTVIEDLGPGNIYWTPAQLNRMTLQTFRDALPILGEITNYSAEQLFVFRSKTLETWGSASRLNDSHMAELTCISQSLSSEELYNVNISSLDTLELLNTCNFTQAQRTAVWQAFERATVRNVAELGELEIIGLGQFICGLQPSQIDQLSSTSFREAVEVVGRAPCPLNITERLKEKAVAAFGKPETWSEALVAMMGNIIAGLSADEIGHLNGAVLPFIPSFVVPLIPPDRFAAMSVSQLKSWGPENAAMVTEAQQGGLSFDQTAALYEAIGVTAPRAESPTVPLPLKGDAPVQSMTGYVVMMQAIMLMLLGYIC